MRQHASILRRSVLALSIALAATAAFANSVPAWLDDAVSNWNKANPGSPIQFVGIKDSYVWYSVAAAPDIDAKAIRERTYSIAGKNGYVKTADEEIVTPGTPAVAKGAARQRKCWTRSFLREIKEGDPDTVQRMLTTMVCEGDQSWSAGFRIIQ